MQSSPLGFSIQLPFDFETTQEKVVAALKTEGFGVLTEIDVRATLKEKLDVEFRPYKILGACNPHLAHQALSLAPQIGLLLPCNVVVQYIAPGLTEVSFVDPQGMAAMAGSQELEATALQARQRLERVAAALQTGS